MIRCPSPDVRTLPTDCDNCLGPPGFFPLTSHSILNNDGYVVERLIHGKDREYNNIKSWNWQKLLDVFDPPAGSYASYRTTNRQELEDLLADPEFAKADKLQ